MILNLKNIYLALILGASLFVLPLNYAVAIPRTKIITIPTGKDRFVPFGITVKAGGSVQWINHDGEEHIIQSVDYYNTVNKPGINHLIVGTGANNGQPGTYTLTFTKTGLFIYYCSIHAKLDSKHQPVSKMGGSSAPMMGVISVVP